MSMCLSISRVADCSLFFTSWLKENRKKTKKHRERKEIVEKSSLVLRFVRLSSLAWFVVLCCKFFKYCE